MYYGLGLTTLSKSNLLKLNRVQNEAARAILGTEKDAPLRPCAPYWTCHSWKHDIRWCKSKCISMRCRISTILSKKKRGVDWQEASHRWSKYMCGLTQLKQIRDWEEHPVEFKPYYETLLPENLVTHCREWPARKANAEV